MLLRLFSVSIPLIVPHLPLIFSHNLSISHSLRWIVFANKKEPVLSFFDKTGLR
jgi:hypothetical protein